MSGDGAPEPAPRLREALATAAAALAAADVERPRDEALQLAAAVLHRPPAEVRLRDGEPLAAAEAGALAALVQRRAAGEPLAYVCGETGFRHLVLHCDRRALIPRPETELLVELALHVVAEGVAADIGTGTGCLALSLAVEGRFRQVVAVDRSADALALAARNRAAVAPAVPVHLLNGDLATALGPATLDLLVSNPPYLTEAEWAGLEPAVRDWEPRLALPSGTDGLAATRQLLDDGRRVLRPGGWIALEVDCRRAAASAALATAFGWTDVAVHHDLFGRERFVLARRSP